MKNKTLYQLIGDGIEELWYFPKDLSEREIRDAFKDYQYSDYESFEEYVEEFNPQLDGERVFVTEIYLD